MDCLNCDVYDSELIRLCEEIENDQEWYELGEFISQLHRQVSNQVGRGTKRSATSTRTEVPVKKSCPSNSRDVSTLSNEEPRSDVNGNTVDFKMVQTVLHILARQMRLLEQKVVLVAGDLPVLRPPGKDGRRRDSELSGDSDDQEGRAHTRKTSVEFRMDGKKGRRGRRGTTDSRDWRGDGGKKGRDRDGRDRSRGGRGRDDDEEERGRRRRSLKNVEDAVPGGSQARRKSKGRGRGRDGDDREGSDDDEGGRGGRGRGADDYDDEKGGRARSRGRRDDDEEHGRGGRGRSHRGRDDDEIEDERGGRGRSRGRYSDDEEDGRGGHGRSRRGRDDDEDESGGHGRSRRGHDDGEDDRGGRGRSRGRDADDEDYDDEKGGHGRSRGGRFDDEDGSQGHGRSGGRRDRDDEEGSRGRTHGGRDREDDSEGRGGRRGKDYEEGRGRDRDGRDGEGETRGRGARGKEGIGIREVDGPGQDKLLVVVKSPTSVGADRDRRDSISVVTQSQFRFLADAVDELREMAGPLPALTMPDNKQLRKDLAAGASLTDTMQAMQVEARVKAAEEAIGKLGGLITQLAASGALPSDDLPGAWGTDAESQLGESGPGGAAMKGKGACHVTEPELGRALKDLREEVTRQLQAPINSAGAAAEAAELVAKSMGGKVEELLKTVERVDEVQSLVEEYGQQLDGFEAGLSTQLTTFKDQMATMRSDLQTGMDQLEAANNNPETAAVMELNERYEELVRGLEDTLLLHNGLTTAQHQLTLELKSLLEGVEMLREQKADRDELLDGLRDKADMMRLEGLVRQEEFDRAREELDKRIDTCHEKFLKQDEVWRGVVRDLEEQANSKALVVDLLKLRDEATAQLRDVNDDIKKLELLLGEPETAMLMRALSRGGACASCLAPALMAPGAAAAPPRLPAARPAPPPEPCGPEHQPPMQPDLRTHKCNRWVGGSHTLLPHERSPAAPLPVLPDVTRKYAGYGNDGRLYFMETAIAPCAESSPEPPPATARSGAGGDAGAEPMCPCFDADVE